MTTLVRQVERRNWKALRKQDWITIDGVDVLLRKRGVGKVFDDLVEIPIVGDAIQYILTPAMRSSLNLGKDATNTAALKAAFLQAVTDSNLDAGVELRKIAVALPKILLDVVVEDAILADDEERVEFRDWLLTLGLSGLMDAIVGWIGLNVPEFRDPLVRGAAWLLQEADKMIKGLASGAAQPQPSSATPDAPAVTAVAAAA